MQPSLSARCSAAVVFVFAAAAHAQEAAPTFVARIASFATWFVSQAQTAHADLTSGDKKRAEVAGKAIGARLAELVPGLRVNFEPVASGQPVTMYLQPGKDRILQVLGRAVVAAMPKVEQFQFVPWRTPAPSEATLVEIGKDPVRLADLIGVCRFDAEHQGVVVHVWNQHLGRLTAHDQARMARYGVERAFGAAMAQRWLRDVVVLDEEPSADNEGYARGADLRPAAMALLPVASEPDLAPELVSDDYFKSDRDFPDGSRCADIAFGASRLPDLVYDLQVSGTPEAVQRLAKVGVTACYVAMTTTTAYDPFDVDAKTEVLRVRKEFAGELDLALTAARVGVLVGTASGMAKGYCDLLLFDRDEARPVLERVAKANTMVRAATLVSFSPTDPKTLMQLK
jgi:hypothetical protein